jgi:hypothetical protein
MNLSVVSTDPFLVRPWRWRPYVPPKCRAFFELHGVTTPKAVLFIVTAVRTSDPSYYLLIGEWDHWPTSRVHHVAYEERVAVPTKGKLELRRLNLTYNVSNSLAHDIILRNTCRHRNIVIPWRMEFSRYVDKRQGFPIYSSVVDNYSSQLSMGSCTRSTLSRKLSLLGGSDGGCHFV